MHEYLREISLPLIASENRVSPAVKLALTSDLNHRYAEGLPGIRMYPGLKYFDQIESKAQSYMCDLLNGVYCDLRPISGTIANLICYTAFTKPGDYLMSLGVSKGGHISIGSSTLGGTAGAVSRLNVARFIFDEDEFNINVDATLKVWKGLVNCNKTPKLVIFGGSVLLFPQPLQELIPIFKDGGAIIIYDAAHVAGLIAGGLFQNPLIEGVDIITMSTHKTFFGPQHGAIICGHTGEDIEIIKRSAFPGLVSNHHLGAVAGVGIAAYELIKHGVKYASQIVRNAKKLAYELQELGFNVLCENKGFTESHIILVDLSKDGGGTEAQNLLEECNIMINKNLLPWDPRFGRNSNNPSGIRIGVQECTRLGMVESDMEDIAFLMNKALHGLSKSKVRLEIKNFMKNFKEVKFCENI